jgi:hypothetical protein
MVKTLIGKTVTGAYLDTHIVRGDVVECELNPSGQDIFLIKLSHPHKTFGDYVKIYRSEIFSVIAP